MSVVAAIRAMLSQGLTIEQALVAAEAIEQSVEPKLTPRQERNRRYYEARKASEKRLNPSETVLVASETSELRRAPSPPPAPSPDKEIPPTPPKENNLFPEPPPQPRVSGASAFEAFWSKFPNKVGKADARKAFDRASKRVDLETMLAGLDRYVHKTDDRLWCNPSTWLNQDRWTDMPAQAPPRPRALRGLAAVEENFRQELENAGYGGQESTDPETNARLPLLAGPHH